jgi:hypothetical protein
MRKLAVGVVIVLLGAGLGGCTKGGTGTAGPAHPKLPTGGFPTAGTPVGYRLAPGAGQGAPKQAKAYLMAPDKVDRNRLKKMAAAFGVKSDTVEGTEGRDFLVSDGTANVGVVWSGLLSWTYGRAVATPPPGAAVAGLPSPAEAEAKARQVLGDAGIDLSGTTAKMGGSQGRHLTFMPTVGGVTVLGLETTVSFGDNGIITYAAGHLSRPKSLGLYDLAPAETALSRATGNGPVVEMATVKQVLLLAADGCTRDPAYLVPGFVFGPAGSGPDALGAGPVPAVVDAEMAKASPPTTTVATAGCAGLPPEETRPVP